MPGGTRVQIGNEVLDQILYQGAVTFPTLTANASATSTQTLVGARPLDMISWNMQSPPAHLVIDNIYVSANDTLTILWGTDGTGVTGATVAVLFALCRPENGNLGTTALPSALV
jgi:hypothetical protein